MAIAKPRTRLVYFRISEEEFGAMVEMCEKTGARSVSDFARSAVREFIANRDRKQSSVAGTVSELAALLDELKNNLQRITAAEAEELHTPCGPRIAVETKE